MTSDTYAAPPRPLVRPRLVTPLEESVTIDVSKVKHARRLAKGIRLHEEGRLEQADRVFRSLDRPTHPHYVARYHRALIAHAIDDFERGIALMESIVEAMPDWPEAIYNLGVFYDRRGDKLLAELYYRRALTLARTFVSAWLNLGNCLIGRGLQPDGLACYEQAKALAPRDPQARVNIAHTLLLLGDYARGWYEYEHRWALPDFRGRNGLPGGDPSKMWTHGTVDPRGKRILVFREQGTGDVIQMLRFGPMLKDLGCEVVWRIPSHLYRLVRYAVPKDEQVVTDAEALPPHDLFVPYMSLPHHLGLTLDTIPRPEGYLSLPPGETPHEITRDMTGLRVGVAWAGSAFHRNDANRSMSVDTLAPLFGIPGTSWMSLQVGKREQEGDAYGLRRTHLADYYETARAMRGLDLVLAVDTSVVHLAGALGVPCFVMVPAVPDFRWLLGRTDTPWYASVRVWRQSTSGDWPELVSRLHTFLTFAAERKAA
jgi:hypothetical protein